VNVACLSAGLNAPACDDHILQDENVHFVPFVRNVRFGLFAARGSAPGDGGRLRGPRVPIASRGCRSCPTRGWRRNLGVPRHRSGRRMRGIPGRCERIRDPRRYRAGQCQTIR